jgi:catechol 2,3-dioxygenase-like lactoylglutathione lyase family enzyme
MTSDTRATIPVARLNHAVLFVRDAQRAAEFYATVFGFEVVTSAMGGSAIFMRSPAGDNHHDLGLFSVGPDAPRAPRGSVGLYHLAWEVPTIEDLARAAELLRAHGAMGGASDHGVSKSLYGSDPDGNEFEIMWRVPRDQSGEGRSASDVMTLRDVVVLSCRPGRALADRVAVAASSEAPAVRPAAGSSRAASPLLVLPPGRCACAAA